MSTRRGFLALVGGAMVTGPTARQWGISRPTLVFPQRPVIVPSADVQLVEGGNLSDYPLLDAMLTAGETQMHAFIGIKGDLPDNLFFGWLEGGLRMAEGYKPGGRIHRAIQADLADGIDPWGKA